MQIVDFFVDFTNSNYVLAFTLYAAIFLAVISLFSGWRRLDFLAIFKPQGLLHLSLFVLIAVGLHYFAHSDYAKYNISLLNTDHPLIGISRLPLYILALAYGPTMGLFAAALYTIAVTHNLPTLVDAVLGLELVVLGWWAIVPSAFKHRWAAPFNTIIAYTLAWGTAGSALFQSQGLDAKSWSVHVNYHQNHILGLLASIFILSLLGPRFFRFFFSSSAIIPKTKQELHPSQQGTEIAIAENKGQRKTRQHIAFEKPIVSSLRRTEVRQRKLLAAPKRIALKSFRDQDH